MNQNDLIYLSYLSWKRFYKRSKRWNTIVWFFLFLSVSECFLLLAVSGIHNKEPLLGIPPWLMILCTIGWLGLVFCLLVDIVIFSKEIMKNAKNWCLFFTNYLALCQKIMDDGATACDKRYPEIFRFYAMCMGITKLRSKKTISEKFKKFPKYSGSPTDVQLDNIAQNHLEIKKYFLKSNN